MHEQGLLRMTPSCCQACGRPSLLSLFVHTLGCSVARPLLVHIFLCLNALFSRLHRVVELPNTFCCIAPLCDAFVTVCSVLDHCA